jgi:hypothetical protein
MSTRALYWSLSYPDESGPYLALLFPYKITSYVLCFILISVLNVTVMVYHFLLENVAPL